MVSEPEHQQAPEDMWNYDDARLDVFNDEWEPETDYEPEYPTEDGQLD